jgi:hypothetical protein
MTPRALAIATLLVILASNTVGAKESGAWARQGNFTHINLACFQAWTCHPKQAILHSAESYVAVTKPKQTVGACGAGTGPADSCNVCFASEPTEQCLWELKRR